MDDRLKYLKVILEERFEGDRDVFHFEGVKFMKGKEGLYETRGFYYEASASIGIPSTCAVMFYVGIGETPDEAFNDLCRKVRTNEKIITELG